MAEEKKSDPFAEKVVTAAGEFPAYPQHIYEDTGEKYGDGSPIMKMIGVAKNPDEHKKLLNKKQEPAWGKK